MSDHDDSSEDIFADLLTPALYPTVTPLENEWIWRFKSPEGGWHFHDVYKFSTVEEFWSLINNIKPVGDLVNNTSYSMFNTDFYPDYECSENDGGGVWVFYGKYDEYTKHGTYEEFFEDFELKWKKILLLAIGNECPEIVGIFTDYKFKSVRISVWLKKCEESKIIEIGNAIRNISDNTCEYKLHDSCKKTNIGTADVKYKITCD